MREVERPVKRPMHCAAIPYIGQSNRGTRWVDTGSELPGGFDNHVYLSDAAVREAMSALGWPLPNEFRQVKAERDTEMSRNAQLEAEVTDLRRQLEAVHVLKQAGYQPSKKPGPKERVA